MSMKRITGVALFLAGFCFATTGADESAFAATFTVNTLGTEPDENPGDGVAEDINGDTSLRAAIEEANTTAARVDKLNRNNRKHNEG